MTFSFSSESYRFLSVQYFRDRYVQKEVTTHVQKKINPRFLEQIRIFNAPPKEPTTVVSKWLHRPNPNPNPIEAQRTHGQAQGRLEGLLDVDVDALPAVGGESRIGGLLVDCFLLDRALQWSQHEPFRLQTVCLHGRDIRVPLRAGAFGHEGSRNDGLLRDLMRGTAVPRTRTYA